MRILAVVPARSGSVRLPGKNLRTVGGVSLVRRAVEQAVWARKQVAGVTVALVSGGEPLAEVEEVEREGEAANIVLRREGPWLSPPHDGWGDGEIAAGYALHVLGASNFDAVMLLQPTSPLRPVLTIGRCCVVFEAHWQAGEPDSVITCCTEGVPNGAVYIAPAQRFYQSKRWGYGTAHWITMSRAEAIDVDCDTDLMRADARARRASA